MNRLAKHIEQKRIEALWAFRSEIEKEVWPKIVEMRKALAFASDKPEHSFGPPNLDYYSIGTIPGGLESENEPFFGAKSSLE